MDTRHDGGARLTGVTGATLLSSLSVRREEFPQRLWCCGNFVADLDRPETQRTVGDNFDCNESP